jgi:hypothetical protein
MKNTNPPQLQLETLLALQNFLEVWRRDPLTQNDLVITSENITLRNNETIISTIEPNIENNTELDELLNSFIDFDNFPVEELTTTGYSFVTEPEPNDILLSQNIEENIPQRKHQDLFEKMKKDLVREEQVETQTRTNPFLANNLKEQVRKIVQRIVEKGKPPSTPQGLLEAYFYLGQIREQNRLDQQTTQEIRNQVKKSLGNRRATEAWLGAQRIYYAFNTCGKSKLYRAESFSLTNVIRLTNEEFEDLVKEAQETEELRMSGVHS